MVFYRWLYANYWLNDNLQILIANLSIFFQFYYTIQSNPIGRQPLNPLNTILNSFCIIHSGLQSIYQKIVVDRMHSVKSAWNNDNNGLNKMIKCYRRIVGNRLKLLLKNNEFFFFQIKLYFKLMFRCKFCQFISYIQLFCYSLLFLIISKS